jgi:hypothetical protein
MIEMKIVGRNSIMIAGVVLILLCAGIFAGCTSPSDMGQGRPAQTLADATPAKVSTVSGQVSVATTVTSNPAIMTSLPYGVTISYPQDWTKQEVQEWEVGKMMMRDYGKETINLGNFFSPRIDPKDPSSYAVFSVDVDPNLSKEELERYFNLATVALQRSYGSLEITKHNYQLKISDYKSYRLDFTTAQGGDRTYIFTDAKGKIYIFSAKNPWADDKWIENMYKSVKIVPPDENLQYRR